jgi:DNA processing protein
MTAVPLQKLTSAELAFPRRLREARELDATLPDALELRGTLREHALSVAIVGARAAVEADLATAAALADAVARRGGLIVSGGAIGIDAAAHRGALAAGGDTVVVLGTGIDVVYPSRHAGLFGQCAGQGAVVSIYPRGAQPEPWRFVARNAVIAALADLVIVVGASARSGALHTASAAKRYGRLLAAAPGADGSERLIARGAALIATPLDLACCLAGAPVRPPALDLPDDGSDDRRVLDVVSDRPRDLEDLADRAGLPLRTAQRVLAALELRGLVRAAPGQTYLRSPLASVTA